MSDRINSYQDLVTDQNFQIPNKGLDEAFGELNITRRSDHLELVVTVLIEPVKEGSQTGVAMDGSDSMAINFGRLYSFSTKFSDDVQNRLINEGKAQFREADGCKSLVIDPSAFGELIDQGYFVANENLVQEFAREAIPYLADKIDEDGGTTLIYWACGEYGQDIELVGDLTGDQAKVAEFDGPSSPGGGTCLLPAVKYFLERFKDADWGIYLFITDGQLDDLEAVKQYTAQLSRDLDAGKVKPVKLVLIGVGEDVDPRQLEELDDLPDTMDLPVDVWDHKIVSQMRNLTDIFAEVVDENTVVAASGRILDDRGGVAIEYTDGVPAIMKFALPLDANSFTLEVGGQAVTQALYV